MAIIAVRRARAGDGRALARIHAEMAAYYVDLAPQHFRTPALEGFERELDAGVGTRLVQAAEAWGRDHGATIAETWTYPPSPLSVPFWEQRMAYEKRSVNLRKRL